MILCDLLWKKLVCPKCGKRALDISKIFPKDVEVALKCPNCHKLVIIPCTEKSVLRKASGNR